ncbi:hypothetical protein GF389_05955 [Candidatus Dojkabacteria bacterium]|nr:hypothetical protein [Candidatus Dojkabacteria bacterium]
MQFHYIQEQIIKKLIGTEDRAKYSELKPEYDIENDLFNYHLQKLVKLGIAEKHKDGYSLSDKGKLITETMYPVGVIRKRADTFKLYAHSIIPRMTENGLKIVNRRRTKHPFYGDIGLVGESVRMGEHSREALARRVKSQVGLDVDIEKMKHVSTVRKTTYLDNGELFSDMIFNYYLCPSFSGEIDKSLDDGNVFWVGIDEAIKHQNNSPNPIHALIEILQDLKKDSILSNYPTHYIEESKTISEY